ncbi:FHA domain-containing protein [bacterium]|nr:FHA domain-containing protein [candidate division CSSED10-310 bacterium]
MIQFHCPSCKKLYAFKFLPIPDDGAEFLCARCDAKCMLTEKNGKVSVELISVTEPDEPSNTQQVYDSYRPDEDEWFTPEELERRLRGLVMELPIGIEYHIGVTEGPDRGVTVPVQKACVMIGKTGCDINLSDISVSREHCRLEIYGHEMMVVRDLDSTWGTFRNGVQVSLGIIRPGDTLQVGKSTLAIIQIRKAHY